MHVDPSGESFLLILGAILVGGAIGGLGGILGAAEDEKWYGTFAGGFINGAINTLGLAAAISTGGTAVILWASGLGFLGGFLGNTTSQIISYEEYNLVIAVLSGGIFSASNLAAYWGISKFQRPGVLTFKEAILPSLGGFVVESYLRPYIPNLNKIRKFNENIKTNQIIFDISWR